MASKGQAKNILILLPAVTDATAIDPKEFTAVCKMTLPMAVIEYCNPIGIPILQSILMDSQSGRHSSLDILRIG